MKTYLIQIGNINRHYNYKVIASDLKTAKENAMKKHKELGRGGEDDKAYGHEIH